MKYLHQLLVATLVLCISVNGEMVQPFKVGVAVNMEDEKTDVCSDEEMEFIRGILKKYVVGLARLFFHDQTVELAGELEEVDGTHFSDVSFEDFNSYEVTKFAGATGKIVDTSGTLSPSASTVPSASPTRSPVEVFLHIEENQVPPVSIGVRAGLVETAAPISSAPIELVETDAPVAPPATSIPVTSAPSAAPVTTAPVTSVTGITLAPISSAPIEQVETDAPVAPPTTVIAAPTNVTNAPIAFAPIVAPSSSAPVTSAPISSAPVTSSPTTSRPSVTPSVTSSAEPSDAPSALPSASPTVSPTQAPSTSPSPAPTNQPSTPPSVSPSQSPSCKDQCVMFDFSQYPDGSPVQRGDYISDEWRETLGLLITVYQPWAYTPYKFRTNYAMGRIFDTNVPIEEFWWGNVGDDDLGSPNEECDPNPGPGHGSGGEPGMPGENCEPLGNVLIIQESQKDTPDSYYWGGSFTFRFDDPVDFTSIGLLDVDPQLFGTKITVYTSNGNNQEEQHTISVDGLGNNAAQEIPVPYSQVTKIVVEMPQDGAITFLNFCLPGCASHSGDDTTSRNLDATASNNDSRGLLRSPSSSLAEPQQHTTNSEPDIAEFAVEPVIESSALGDRELRRGYKFVYGGKQAWMCRFCGRDSRDGRRSLTSNSGFLISALETVLSFGLTADMSWSYKEFLEQRNQTIGCLGDGNLLRVAFELTAATTTQPQ